jgi:hypothetical protein
LFRLIRQPIEDRFKLQASRLERGFIGFARDPDRISIKKEASGKRIWDQVAIPARKEFFFEQAKASGTMGRPVAFAR